MFLRPQFKPLRCKVINSLPIFSLFFFFWLSTSEVYAQSPENQQVVQIVPDKKPIAEKVSDEVPNMVTANPTPVVPLDSINSKKEQFAKKILRDYHYNTILDINIDQSMKPYETNPKVNTKEFKAKLLELCADLAYRELLANYTYGELSKMSELLESAEGKRMIRFWDKFYDLPHPKVLSELNFEIKIKADQNPILKAGAPLPIPTYDPNKANTNPKK